MSEAAVIILYDGECPLCQAYCRTVRLRQAAGQLVLADARTHSGYLAQITALGIDINQTMAVSVGGIWYSGADALHMLALLSSRSGVFNRLNYHLFKLPAVARYSYPVLRSCRNLLLRLLGKTLIKTPDNSPR